MTKREYKGRHRASESLMDRWRDTYMSGDIAAPYHGKHRAEDRRGE